MTSYNSSLRSSIISLLPLPRRLRLRSTNAAMSGMPAASPRSSRFVSHRRIITLLSGSSGMSGSTAGSRKLRAGFGMCVRTWLTTRSRFESPGGGNRLQLFQLQTSDDGDGAAAAAAAVEVEVVLGAASTDAGGGGGAR